MVVELVVTVVELVISSVRCLVVNDVFVRVRPVAILLVVESSGAECAVNTGNSSSMPFVCV